MWIDPYLNSLEEHKVRFAIAGGYAVNLHGALRGTVDLDLVLVLTKKNLSEAQAALEEAGLRSRLPVGAAEVFDFREEYIKTRNLVAWSFYNPANPAEIVDLVITHDLARMKVEEVKVRGRILPVLSIEDLISMKRASGRPQDREDVRALEQLKEEG